MNSTRNSPAENPFKESSILVLVKDYGWVTLTVAITTVAVNFFFISTGLTPGGIIGLSLVCSTVLDISVSTISLCISISPLILSTIILGKSFGIKTLCIALATLLFMKLIPSTHITQFPLDIHPLLELVVAGLLEGLLVGAAVGIALNHACATGGTDVMALLIQYVFKFLKASMILFFLDGSVMIIPSVIIRDALISVFSFPLLMVIT